jgi:ribulose-5-phosphate 4-epimerase/fuculose-1-phosphate aldolase
MEAASHALTQQLVDAIRMLERAGIVNHSGHCSARRDAASFFINSGGSVRSSLTVGDIVAVDLDGNLLGGGDPPPLEFHIHSELYRARPDVNAVMHTHPQWSTFLTMTGTPYKRVYAPAVLPGEMEVLDSALPINTRPMGERLAAAVGMNCAALIKAHGAVTVGGDVVEAFVRAAYLEENAYRQYMAIRAGEPYVFSEAEQQACGETSRSDGLFKNTWDHYFSRLHA